MHIQHLKHKDVPENYELAEIFSFDKPHEQPADYAAVITHVNTARSYVGFGDSKEQAIQHAISQVKS